MRACAHATIGRRRRRYISVDASDIDTAIDPTTGKNLTITKAPGSKPKANTTDVGAAEESPPEKAPWLLRVLGIETAKGDDDGFWQPPAATVPRDGGGGGGGGSGGAGGADGAEGADGDGDGDGLEEDASDVDALDDLLG